MPIRPTTGGYSLFELIMTVAVVAVVMALGVPSFGKMLADHRLKVEVDALFHAVHLARKESIVRRRAVTLCPSADGQNCVPGFDWSTGWIMFVNHDRSNADHRDEDEPILRRSGVVSGVRISANRRHFALRSTELRATNGTLVFCDENDRITPRALVISYTGRPRVTLQNSRGKPYSCAY